jgi:hypothetical protein
VRRLLALAVAAAVVVGFWSWWSSDRRRLAARLAELEALFEKDGPEDQLTAFGRTRAIVARFAPGFVVLARPYQATLTEPQQLAAAVQAYRSGAERVEIDHGERELELDAGRGVAEMRALFSVSGRGAGGPGAERFRARIAWAKHEGEWMIQEFEVLEVVERGGLLGL